MFGGCFGGVPGCSGDVPGMFQGVPEGVPGGVPGGCSGVFRVFTDTPKFLQYMNFAQPTQARK